MDYGEVLSALDCKTKNPRNRGFNSFTKTELLFGFYIGYWIIPYVKYKTLHLCVAFN
jgi:hypothetical protein